MSSNVRSQDAARHRAVMVAVTIALALLLTLLCARALGGFTGPRHAPAAVTSQRR